MTAPSSSFPASEWTDPACRRLHCRLYAPRRRWCSRCNGSVCPRSCEWRRPSARSSLQSRYRPRTDPASPLDGDIGAGAANHVDVARHLHDFDVGLLGPSTLARDGRHREGRARMRRTTAAAARPAGRPPASFPHRPACLGVHGLGARRAFASHGKAGTSVGTSRGTDSYAGIDSAARSPPGPPGNLFIRLAGTASGSSMARRCSPG